MDYLEFEEPIAELQAKIEELKKLSENEKLKPEDKVDITEELERLQKKSQKLEANIFSSLDSWQISQLSRHPLRPYTLDYVDLIFDEFQELHGDRMYADDHALVGGTARLGDFPVMVIGQQKGRKTNDKIYRNFGMPRPEGYRKALRLMKMAERFDMPVITFIDTPGAYPGIGAEERGQSEAIARNLFEMAQLKTPIISTVIGEGGSGGALAIGVADRLLMLQYATYSVISPEGCASILWKSADKAKEAAEALKLTANHLYELGLTDEVLPEPEGGAHRDIEQTAATIREALLKHLSEVKRTYLNDDELLEKRYERLMNHGKFDS
ncbi:MAG: acetyl-CoA carboxylase carboxyl transferase subunit alpha [Arenicella sp.]